MVNRRGTPGHLPGRQGKTSEAVETNRETIAEGGHLAKNAPDNSSVAWTLFLSSARSCTVVVQQNDNASVNSDCAPTMELLRRLVRLDPNNPGYKKILLDFEKLLQRQQVRAATEAGRYAEALALREQIASRVEGEEAKSAGKPGKNTAGELANLAWQALLAGEPSKAIAACEQSFALQPGDLYAEIYRAHALMYLDRGEEARNGSDHSPAASAGLSRHNLKSGYISTAISTNRPFFFVCDLSISQQCWRSPRSLCRRIVQEGDQQQVDEEHPLRSESRWCRRLSMPIGMSKWRMAGRSASTLSLSRPAQASLTLRPVGLLSLCHRLLTLF